MPSWQNFTVLLACFRQYMEELVTYVERNPRNKKCSKWKSDAILSSLPTFLREAIRPTAWRECYTKHDIQACLSRVQTVGYNEKRVKILVDWFNIFHSSLLICPPLSLYSLVDPGLHFFMYLLDQVFHHIHLEVLKCMKFSE